MSLGNSTLGDSGGPRNSTVGDCGDPKNSTLGDFEGLEKNLT